MPCSYYSIVRNTDRHVYASVIASETVILMDLTDGHLLMGRKLCICAHSKARHIAYANHAPSLLLSVESSVLVLLLIKYECNYLSGVLGFIVTMEKLDVSRDNLLRIFS